MDGLIFWIVSVFFQLFKQITYDLMLCHHRKDFYAEIEIMKDHQGL